MVYLHIKLQKNENKSQTTIRYWLKKYDLQTKRGAGYDKNQYKEERRKLANKKTVIRLGNLRKNNRQLLINLKGGKCIKCGYNRCIFALDFHHRDPLNKQFNLSSINLSKNLEVLKKEVDKCDVLCSNCHRELHYCK